MTTTSGGCSITAARGRALGGAGVDRTRLVRSRRAARRRARVVVVVEPAGVEGEDAASVVPIEVHVDGSSVAHRRSVHGRDALRVRRWGDAGPDAAPAAALGEYGSGLGYFQRLEAERAISEEPVPLSRRSERRASSPPAGASANATRGIPLSLGADDDDVAESNVAYTEPDFSDAVSSFGDPRRDPSLEEVRASRLRRAAFQWSVIAAVAYNAYRARTRGSDVTKRLGLEGKAATQLAGTRWRLTLDIGRERGTWMPPEWGASGFRVILPMAVELGANGVVTPIAIGGFAPMTVSAGKWRLEGDALKFDVKTSGMAKGDVTLPEDSLHFRTAAWGGTMASRGNLMLLQTRFGFRREWRMVGVFKAEPLLDDDEDDDDRKGGEGGEGGGDEESRERRVLLESMRVTERKTS